MPLYDEIEIEDMTYDPETMLYSYPCPCGDRFKITLEDLWDGDDEAGCESCTLYIEVIYDEEDLPPLLDDDDDDEIVDNPIIQDDCLDRNDEAAVSKAMCKLSFS
jgi:diphthamide biosynthesis protein 3